MATNAAHVLDLEPQTQTPTTLLHFPAPVSASPLSVPAQQPGPLATPPRPRLASSNPESLSSAPDLDLGPFSLLEDLKQAQQQHHGMKEKITLYQFPAYLTTNLRRVLARNTGHRADWAVAFSCLVWRGLLRYTGLPAAQELSDGLLELDTDDGLGTVAGEQVEMWRKGFRYSVPDPTHSMGFEARRSWKAPEHVHAELYERAGKLGISGSSLGVVCVMAALESQNGVLVEHGRYMREAVAELDRLIEERARRLRGLSNAITAGVWG